MSSVESIARLGVVAAQQWGYVTTAQAQTQGVSRDRLSKLSRAGALEPVGHGVHRMAGVPAPAHEAIYVAYVSLRDRAEQVSGPGDTPPLVVSGHSAALLHDMGDYWPGAVEFFTRAPVRSSRTGVKLVRRALQRRDVVWASGLPTLSGNATIRELVREGGDLSLVSSALMDGLQEGKIDLAELGETLDEVAPMSGYSSGQDLAEALLRGTPLPRSVQEWYLARLPLERAAA